MKKYLSLLLSSIFFFSFASFAQQAKLDANQPCDSVQLSDFRSIEIDGHTYSYLIFNETENALNGTQTGAWVLVNNFRTMSLQTKKAIAQQLRKRFGYTTIFLIADCGVRRIYYQALKPSPEQERKLANDMIGFNAKEL